MIPHVALMSRLVVDIGILEPTKRFILDLCQKVYKLLASNTEGSNIKDKPSLGHILYDPPHCSTSAQPSIVIHLPLQTCPHTVRKERSISQKMSSSRSSDSEDKGGYRQINKALNICAFEDYLNGQTASLQPIPDVEQVTERVLRVRGQNPGKFTFQGTNTFLLGTGPSRILIDTSGGEPEYAELLAATLKSRNISIKHVLVTHWHGDHSGGIPDLIRMYPHLEDEIYKNDPELGQREIVDGQVFSVEGATVVAVHCPGHSEDHMCFILKEENSMFTGDNVLGTGTSAVEDLGIFMQSLQKMQNQNCTLGHPAHGQTIKDLHNKIARELASKYRREKQVIKALRDLREAGEKKPTVQDIVSRMYGSSVDETTRTLALEPFIDEVLRKLAGDGKVGFEIRAGRKKRWFLVPHAVEQQHMSRTQQLRPSFVQASA